MVTNGIVCQVISRFQFLQLAKWQLVQKVPNAGISWSFLIPSYFCHLRNKPIKVRDARLAPGKIKFLSNWRFCNLSLRVMPFAAGASRHRNQWVSSSLSPSRVLRLSRITNSRDRNILSHPSAQFHYCLEAVNVMLSTIRRRLDWSDNHHCDDTFKSALAKDLICIGVAAEREKKQEALMASNPTTFFKKLDHNFKCVVWKP